MVRQQKNEELMAAGVTLIDPATDLHRRRRRDRRRHGDPPVRLSRGPTTIGAACEIHSGSASSTRRSAIACGVRNHSVVTDVARSPAGAFVGPFAHTPPGLRRRRATRTSATSSSSRRRRWAPAAKANHLAYLGDATIGADVNIGAGTITCNYDGERKHQTVIGDGAFVGSDCTLVAPVTVGDGAYIAAGSAITEDVPAGALGIARGPAGEQSGMGQGRSGQDGEVSPFQVRTEELERLEA